MMGRVRDRHARGRAGWEGRGADVTGGRYLEGRRAHGRARQVGGARGIEIGGVAVVHGHRRRRA